MAQQKFTFKVEHNGTTYTGRAEYWPGSMQTMLEPASDPEADISELYDAQGNDVDPDDVEGLYEAIVANVENQYYEQFTFIEQE